MATIPPGDPGLAGMVKDRVNPFISYAKFSLLIFMPRTLADCAFEQSVSLWDSIKTYLTAIAIFGIVAWIYGTAPEISGDPTVEELIHVSGAGSVPVVGSLIYAAARAVGFVMVFLPVHFLLNAGYGSTAFKGALTVYFVYCAVCAPLDALFIYSGDETIKLYVALFFLAALFLLLLALAHVYGKSVIRVAATTLLSIGVWALLLQTLLQA